MKNIFKNLVLFAALSVAFSNLTACTNTATTQKDSVSETAPNGNSNANAGATEAKTGNHPPVPSGILQADIKDLDGGTFRLEDKKGKVVLLNLWAIWCGPCVAEMPEFVRMQNQYKDKNFEVIGLNEGDEDMNAISAEEIKAFGEQRKINYQLAFGDEKMFTEIDKLTRIGGIPQTMIINREGKMTLVVGGGGPRVMEKIKEAVEKTVNE